MRRGSSPVNWGMQKLTYFIQQLLVPTQWEDHCLTWIVQMPCSPIKFPNFTAAWLRLVCENRSAANAESWKMHQWIIMGWVPACVLLQSTQNYSVSVCSMDEGVCFHSLGVERWKQYRTFCYQNAVQGFFFKVEAFAVAQHGCRLGTT